MECKLFELAELKLFNFAFSDEEENKRSCFFSSQLVSSTSHQTLLSDFWSKDIFCANLVEVTTFR